mgnify:CR=1 FL=1
MAGLIEEQLAVDSEYFVDADGFGESVTYKPQSGGSRAINAVVDRTGTHEIFPGSDITVPVISVLIRNDATYGASTVVQQGDVIELAQVFGGSVADFTIRKIEDSDHGMWRLILQ